MVFKKGEKTPQKEEKETLNYDESRQKLFDKLEENNFDENVINSIKNQIGVSDFKGPQYKEIEDIGVEIPKSNENLQYHKFSKLKLKKVTITRLMFGSEIVNEEVVTEELKGEITLES
ncbi:MAG: hypothetical protein KC589_09890 [Nanoarchaeota archaeon]|nr:hypothetical protein [Nanoarchaeota archaeon]